MSKFLEGKKTYTSLVILLLGVFKVGGFISDTEVAVIINAAFELLGTIGVIYGRAKAKPKVN